MYFNKQFFVIIAICVLVFIASANGVPFSDKRINANSEKLPGLTKAALACVKDTNIDEKIFFQIRHGNYEETDDVKNFFYCTFKKHEAVSEYGVVNPEKILEMYPEDDKSEVSKVLDMCIKESESSTVPKDKVFNFFKCFQHNTPAHVL